MGVEAGNGESLGKSACGVSQLSFFGSTSWSEKEGWDSSQWLGWLVKSEDVVENLMVDGKLLQIVMPCPRDGEMLMRGFG